MRNCSFTLIAIIFAIFVASCSQPTDSDADNYMPNNLYGTWVKAGYEENITILRKSGELDDNQYGFIIRRDGKLTERKNSGYCGTPPITYANYEGEWKKLSDSLLEIAVGYWGGTTSYRMEIVSISYDELKISYHYDD
jgi:hypothetical protein